MRIIDTPLPGAFVLEQEPRSDERGFFARFFCQNEFGEAGLETAFVQANNSMSVERGTLRGLHYQRAPHEEVKVVRCIAGAIWDVIGDLRSDSPAYGKWFAAELTAANRRMMYVPRGVAHGHITLEPRSEIIYLVSDFYAPDHEAGIRWDDPFFGVEWPLEPQVISDKDRTREDFDGALAAR